jgi:L-amino acid N-acyltransferase YncA
MIKKELHIAIEPIPNEAWPQVARIYEAGIATKNATFEKQAPTWEAWNTAHRTDCRLIAKMEHQIVGWAALSNVSSRCVYAGVAEVSIYVDPEFQGLGIGNHLMRALIAESELNGIWTLQAGIFPENTGSINLHHKHGFRTIGVKERIGKMDNTWRNVALLERRSNVIGID